MKPLEYFGAWKDSRDGRHRRGSGRGREGGEEIRVNHDEQKNVEMLEM